MKSIEIPEVELLGRSAAGCGPEIRGLHQAVAVAVEVEYARTGDFETAAGVSLRVKFDQLQFVAGEAGNEGNVVVFGHGVVDATFIYPTGGDKVVQVAMDILEKRPYERDTKQIFSYPQDKRTEDYITGRFG